MKNKTIKNFGDYLDKVEVVAAEDKIMALYRGQSEEKTLLPSIARDKPSRDTTSIEVEMLNELKRRAQTLLVRELKDKWDWLVFAQHYGMKTRLLDWTSNPLAALWFACSNEYKIHQDSFVYIFLANKTMLLDKSKDTSPFHQGKTKILRPPQNNDRIIAQSGWFTAHKFSKSLNSFVGLEKNKSYKERIIKLLIPADEKPDILKKLDKFGVNNQTIFPDFEGVCKQLNWEYEK
ncbi:MAG: FRG domain-containing protein [bacterium]